MSPVVQELLCNMFPDISDELWDAEEAKLCGCPNNEQTWNTEGVYAVRFWRSGHWRVVIVDDYIPVNKRGNPVYVQGLPDATTRYDLNPPFLCLKL